MSDPLISLLRIAAYAEEVRTAQKRYFAHRSRENLIVSKELERLLDAAIAERKSQCPTPTPSPS